VGRDYAKRGSGRGTRTSARSRPAARSVDARRPATGGGWRIYLAGVLTGVFGSLLAYLAIMQGPATQPEQVVTAPAVPEPPKPRFDFYKTLPVQRLEADLEPVEKEPAADLPAPGATAPAQEQFLLQAGSFRQRGDAEGRRAELLLLGLEPTIEESGSDGDRWHRVYLGPFQTHAEMNRVRGLAAAQDIATLLVKRGPP